MKTTMNNTMGSPATGGSTLALQPPLATLNVGVTLLLACFGQDRDAKEPRLMTRLGSSSFGRVVLHTLCVVKHPDRLGWHWRGIVREFAGASRAVEVASSF